MKNDLKPVNQMCPKCGGHYVLGNEDHRCMNCGYRYNPPITHDYLERPHCCFGQCVTPIGDLKRIFCHKHQGEVIREDTIQCMKKQQRRDWAIDRLGDVGTRHSMPVMVKLRDEHKKKAVP